MDNLSFFCKLPHKKLNKLTTKRANLKTVGKNAVKGIHAKAVVKVPKKQVKAYNKLFNSKTGFKKTGKLVDANVFPL